MQPWPLDMSKMPTFTCPQCKQVKYKPNTQPPSGDVCVKCDKENRGLLRYDEKEK